LAKSNSTFPFGVDPAWKTASNELQFYNSMKMKMSIVIAYFHMMLGIVMQVKQHKEKCGLLFQMIELDLEFVLTISNFCSGLQCGVFSAKIRVVFRVYSARSVSHVNHRLHGVAHLCQSEQERTTKKTTNNCLFCLFLVGSRVECYSAQSAQHSRQRRVGSSVNNTSVCSKLVSVLFFADISSGL
jgi:hypothetical protein